MPRCTTPCEDWEDPCPQTPEARLQRQGPDRQELGTRFGHSAWPGQLFHNHWTTMRQEFENFGARWDRRRYFPGCGERLSGNFRAMDANIIRCVKPLCLGVAKLTHLMHGTPHSGQYRATSMRHGHTPPENQGAWADNAQTAFSKPPVGTRSGQGRRPTARARRSTKALAPGRREKRGHSDFSIDHGALKPRMWTVCRPPSFDATDLGDRKAAWQSFARSPRVGWRWGSASRAASPKATDVYS